MIAAIRTWLQGRAIGLLGGALFAAVVAFGVQTWRVDKLQFANAELSRQLKDAKAAADLSEQLRGQEQAQDHTSYADQSARCEQRVITALDAARAIEEITNANSSSAVADRPIVPAIELRRIIGQTGSGTARVPTGSDRTAKP